MKNIIVIARVFLLFSAIFVGSSIWYWVDRNWVWTVFAAIGSLGYIIMYVGW